MDGRCVATPARADPARELKKITQGKNRLK